MEAEGNPALAGRPGSEVSEKVVRAMRDQVYGHFSTDKNWDGCRENWMRPESIAWLRARISKSPNAPKSPE